MVNRMRLVGRFVRINIYTPVITSERECHSLVSSKSFASTSERVSSFLTAHHNILGHSVPHDGEEDICKH